MEPTIRKSTHDLALLIAGQVHAAKLTEEAEMHFLKNKEQVAPALRRGFILPGQEQPALIKVTEKDLNWWLKMTEGFAKKHLGVEINLRERFAIPTEFPWQSVIPVFDPRGLTNRDMVEKALKGPGHSVWEETDVMSYAGSEAGTAPTLHFIENSVRPNDGSMNLSPNQLRANGRNYLRLRGYGLAFALYHFAKGKPLDPETCTWFPEDRLPGGSVAVGSWLSDSSRVRVYWDNPGDRRSNDGARVAMQVPLKP